MNVAIFSNSPGELFSWVRPVCYALRDRLSAVNIHIYLTPCQYATGEEVNVVKSFPNVVQVFTPSQTLAQIWSPTLLPDRVVFLGGDPMYAKRLAKKAKYR